MEKVTWMRLIDMIYLGWVHGCSIRGNIYYFEEVGYGECSCERGELSRMGSTVGAGNKVDDHDDGSTVGDGK